MSKLKTTFTTQAGENYSIEIETPDRGAFDIYRTLRKDIETGDLDQINQAIETQDLRNAVTIRGLALEAL